MKFMVLYIECVQMEKKLNYLVDHIIVEKIGLHLEINYQEYISKMKE